MIPSINPRPFRLVKPVFIVGCPRSGTTVLGACLGAHPGIGGADESMFLGSFARIYQNHFEGTGPRRDGPLKKYISQRALVESLGACADEIIGSLLSNLKKPRYVDHTPWYGLWMGFINRIYPDATFLHLVRDGRDVVDSLCHSYEHGYQWAGSSFEERARLWVRLVSSCRRCAMELNLAESKRYKEVLYEDLCADPYHTLEGVLQFLGLPMVQDALHPLAQPHASPSRTNRTLAVLDRQGVMRAQPVRTGGSWPEHWGPAERAEFLRIAGPTLAAFNYPGM